MSARPLTLRTSAGELELGGQPWLMGIVNATPDSFSDAGVRQTLEERVALAAELLDAGARLIDIGFAEIRLLVERPPRRLDAAQRIAAEHFAFCDECGGKGLRDISSIAVSLVNAPIWTFWWD